VEDVICFTYGKKGNREAEISRQVAEALGYRWYFVECTKEKLYNSYHSRAIVVYKIYSSNLTSLPHTQDFLAIKELKEEGKIPENAIFVPGHQGLVAGSLMHRGILAVSHVYGNYDLPDRYTRKRLQEDLVKNYYNLWSWDNIAEITAIFNEKIQVSINEVTVDNVEEYANALEFFEFNERKSKYIINSVRAYEFFEYGWRLPLIDADLVNFFLHIPLSLRIRNGLYKSYAGKRLFTQQMRPLSEIECTTNISNGFKEEKAPTLRLLHKLSDSVLKYFDSRWERYYQYPIVTRIFNLFGCGYDNPFPKGGLLHKIVRYNQKPLHRMSLGGYRSKRILSLIITTRTNRGGL